ncbi:DUF4402 domain-containing protein [Rheinheimera sp. D18]|uniref:DUF4402 domain-containing protein n=1 Tax=Rheinheimera sp. D18 TaxID=2545632 RepID=UPI00104CE092|nr:DUF4402 domain-containing protein [Rheinheimera sp. D18]QBL09936.1 DUF4402 domain-containing protein [Rheinheimera sp. D18]
MIKYLLVVACCLLSQPTWAAFLIDSPLSFGEIAIRNNNSVSSTTITRNGKQTSTNQIYVIKPGTPGVYTLNGMAAYTLVNLSVNLPAWSAMPYPSTAQFEISAVDIPSVVNVNSSGAVQFRIGATLRTSGNPVFNYVSNATYVVYLNLNLDY